MNLQTRFATLEFRKARRPKFRFGRSPVSLHQRLVVMLKQNVRQLFPHRLGRRSNQQALAQCPFGTLQIVSSNEQRGEFEGHLRNRAFHVAEVGLQSPTHSIRQGSRRRQWGTFQQ